MIRAEADLSAVPADLEPLVVRLIHAAGDPGIVSDLAWTADAAAAGRRALAAGASVLVDAEMVASGITRDRLPAANPVLCTLREPGVAEAARAAGTTRSAAAVDRWRDRLEGAVVVIGNAPTALFRMLELLDAGAPRPAVGLTPSIRTLIDGAELLVGGERHQAMVADTAAERLTWEGGVHRAAGMIARWRGRRVVVLATGDPMWFGGGANLARVFGPGDMAVLPHPGAFSLRAPPP
ncbi:MAG: precorrin-8X methylmutase [Rhodospirillales bacterium]|nr:precorrin-8X methylmutase [Rhodospirillales bacterium]